MSYYTRRELLTGLGKGLFGVGFLNALRPSFSFASSSTGNEARYLVIVRLVGGLDALGAFPFIGSAHGSAISARRQRIGTPTTSAILDNSTGLALNSALQPLLPDFLAGQMKIVFGIGNRSFTPGLNLSHEFNQQFQAAGGSPSQSTFTRGYMASAQEVYHLDRRQVVGLGINGGAELAHPNTSQRPMSVAGLSGLDFPRLDDMFGGQTETDAILAASSRLRELHAARIGPQAPTAPVVEALDRMEEAAQLYRSINQYSVPGRFAGYTDSSLGNGLVGIAKTIASLDSENRSRIFLSGYQRAEWDTHNDQALGLQNNLNDLATNLAAFIADLKGLGSQLWERTTIVTISEFGRRIYENGTGGTDHGTGGASVILGGDVAGGVLIDPAVTNYAWSTQEYVPVAFHFQNVLAQPFQWMGFNPDLIFDPQHYIRSDLGLFRTNIA